MSFNRVILLGRLTSDPERRVTQSGVEASIFTVACNRPKDKEGGQQADFPRCVAWRGVAEFVNRYFRKGKPILLEGRLSTRSYEDKSKGKIFVTEVIVSSASFVEGEKAQGIALPEPPDERSGGQTSTLQEPSPMDGFVEIDKDGDLPF